MRTIFGPDTDRATELFPAAGDDQVPAAMYRVITVTSFRAPARRLVRWMEAADGDAWLYHFSRNPGQGRAVRDGVFHGLEIGYVFNTLTAWGDATDKTLGQDMLRRWVNFARDGNPNGAPGGTTRTDPVWPKYRAAEDEHLEFADPIRVQAGLDREPCDLADRAVARRNRDGVSEP